MTLLLLVLTLSGANFFDQGNAAYEAGQYEQAVVYYDSALIAGPSAGLYYNRGNAWFKQGQVGRAIADYARAHALAPLDRDIRHILAFARSYRPDKNLAVGNPLGRLLTELLRPINLWVVRFLAGFSFFAAMAALGVYFVSGRRLFGWVALGLGLLFVYCAAAWWSWSTEVNASRAVVVVPELTLRSGPGPEYKEIAVVHDGLEGTARERRPGYLLMQIPGGLGGWADTASVELIHRTPVKSR
ncbi:MAG: tetratricopeptide repeat protein [candidate division WOR-3 bacterium]